MLGGSSGIAVAMGVMNVATYGYTIVAARLLGPSAYGGFAAAMGLLLILSVLQLGLQATGARRVASSPSAVGAIEKTLLGVTYRAALALALATLVLAPVLNSVLHLDSVLTAVFIALTVAPLTVMGGQAGILQGERRWFALALLYMAAGVPRFVVGTVLLVVQPSEPLAVLGVAIGAIPPVIVGWLALRRSASTRTQTGIAGHGRRTVLWETVRNSHALLAFFVLSNADVLLSRNVLDRHDSGLYAGGVILVKTVLFLPQFVVVIAFPSMSSQAQRRTTLVKSITVVLGLGVVGTIASYVLSPVALIFIGGDKFAEIADRLWLFAIIGTVLSLLQLLVYSVVARQSQWSVYLIWTALVVLAVTATQVHTVVGLAVTVCLVDGALFVVLLAISLWRLRTRPEVEREVAVARG